MLSFGANLPNKIHTKDAVTIFQRSSPDILKKNKEAHKSLDAQQHFKYS
jgi:hypothetical protein